jgi:hypothetical protein
VVAALVGLLTEPAGGIDCHFAGVLGGLVEQRVSSRGGQSMERRRAGVLWLVVLCLGVVCGTLLGAGCGSGSTPRTVPVQSTAPVPVRQSVPLIVNHASAGWSCLVVDVSVGGGRSVPVIVDTGSAGLLLNANAIGPNAQVGGRSFSSGFVGAPTFTVTVVSAQVNIGGPAGVTTPQPVAIGSVASKAPMLGFSHCGGAQGVLGVGVGNPGPAVPPLESPLVQLAPSLSDGYTITLTGNTGTLLVGKPAISPASVSLPLPEENGTYPNGHQAYQRDVTLCWTVGTVRGCGLTNIDSGFSFPAIRPDFLSALPHQGPLIAAGTSVSITAPTGAALQSFITASAPPEVRLALARLFGSTEANTGIGFFFANSVGFDVSAGHVVITPK